MAQVVRPDGVVGAGGWTGGYTDINEVTPSDTNYIESPAAPVGGGADDFEVSLGDPVDPLSSSGHVLTYRYAKNASGGSQVNLTVYLKQGGTTVASASHTNIGSSFTEGTLTLSGAEADAITDYSDLRVVFRAQQV